MSTSLGRYKHLDNQRKLQRLRSLDFLVGSGLRVYRVAGASAYRMNGI